MDKREETFTVSESERLVGQCDAAPLAIAHYTLPRFLSSATCIIIYPIQNLGRATLLITSSTLLLLMSFIVTLFEK